MDIERARLRQRLDDLDSEIGATSARVERLRNQIADLEDKRRGLQREYDETWLDYDELGGFHLEALAADNRGV